MKKTKTAWNKTNEKKNQEEKQKKADKKILFINMNQFLNGTGVHLMTTGVSYRLITLHVKCTCRKNINKSIHFELYF